MTDNVPVVRSEITDLQFFFSGVTLVRVTSYKSTFQRFLQNTTLIN